MKINEIEDYKILIKEYPNIVTKEFIKSVKNLPFNAVHAMLFIILIKKLTKYSLR